MKFESLGLSANILHTVKQMGFAQVFPIQAQAIPPILAGKDVMAVAPTGTGKTASFVMPVLDQLQQVQNERNRSVQILVLVPTRELAVQIDEVFRVFSEPLRRSIRTLAVYGGVSIQPQMKAIMGVEVLVATPGRLLELIEKHAVDITAIRQLVIDEADKLFQLGFEAEMDQILSLLPAHKQTMLYSATLNDKVTELKSRLGIQPVVITIEPEQQSIEDIEQLAYLVTAATKGPFLRYLIKEQQLDKALVFVSSQRTADNVVDKLKKNKINAVAVHANKSQNTRMEGLAGFKAGKNQVLVATDLIGRGIHIESLPVVINYELPRAPLDYVHRIGRTGRALKQGKAITLITEEELPHFKLIQKKMGKNVTIIDAADINLHGY
ncbi:MAG: RNA helicase [Bacteroidetes bacterium 43-16]|nr:MAG: RNA helicase [Bacteroidetes bacterium 43-16]